MMHSSVGATIAIGTVTALLAGFAAVGELRAPSNEAGGTIAVADTAAIPRDSTGAPIKPRWVNDANVLSLLAVMNTRAISAADVELENWHVDTVRAFAASMAREHAELQHVADSVALAAKMAPQSSALSASLGAQMQAQFDSIVGHRSVGLDRAFLQQQVASHALMREYVNELAAVAQRPELQSLLATAASRVSSQLTRATALQTSIARRDSIVAADSAAARAARAARTARAAKRDR
jgi:uncharacterized protein DUF4142